MGTQIISVKTGFCTPVDIRERICISGQMISHADFTDLTKLIAAKLPSANLFKADLSRANLFKADLKLTDAQTSLPLTGFVIVYMLASPIFGSLADRWPRKVLIAAGVGFVTRGPAKTTAQSEEVHPPPVRPPSARAAAPASSPVP